MVTFPGTDKAIFDAWVEHMKDRLAASLAVFAQSTNSIN
ncbi:hypothetical protein DAQ1742_00639 [Dickeya aquatica]|uniref:Uncharacterized protein n=1 Tax=Dickeya aquatica TaxID=1401087 RepID=A0A375A6N9_9GAMM|nr:hypothetical protein DAQ1742_00639 [Dickeya aquatica]